MFYTTDLAHKEKLGKTVWIKNKFGKTKSNQLVYVCEYVFNKWTLCLQQSYRETCNLRIIEINNSSKASSPLSDEHKS